MVHLVIVFKDPHHPSTQDSDRIHLPIFSATRAGRVDAKFNTLVRRFPLRFSISKRDLHSFFVIEIGVFEKWFVPSNFGKIGFLNLVTLQTELGQPIQFLKAVDAGDLIAIGSQLPQVSKTLQF
jgi:hypothetical protein